ncbi:MAG TPA: ATP-dependent DNA helicase [Candidatus Nanopelagicales bacterium]
MTRGRGEQTTVRLERELVAPLQPPVLDVDQRAVVEHRDGHLLVLAGPGTGKTTTLAELVVHRLAPGPDQLAPDSVLALTFGRRAANELAERISRRLSGGPVPVVATFHAFAYGLVRQYADPLVFQHPPRLLTAAEQDLRLRELLSNAVTEGRLAWPASLQAAVGTRGIAEQVRTLLARARGLDLDGAALRAYGRAGRVPVWSAVGRFFEEYLDVLGWEEAIDYAELIQRAVTLAADERTGPAVRAGYRLIVVDEYQDTDPAQVQLVRALARGGAQVVAVGDPDQAIYGFRGADVRGILEFPERFADPVTGAPAPITVLGHTRRFPAAIASAAQGVLGPVVVPRLPREVVRRHRSPSTPEGPARVEARTYPSATAEAAGVVDTLLRAHAGLDGDRLDWPQMAVLVRSPALAAPTLTRAMRGAGIPVVVPPDELALADEPAVSTLLGALALALDPGAVAPETGRALLAGPVGRLDPIAIRALGRAALAAEREAGGLDAEVVPDLTPLRLPELPEGQERPSSSDRLLTAALAAGRLPTASAVPGAARAGFGRVAATIAAAREQLAAEAMVSEVLWAAWRATDWAQRLRRAALQGGRDGQAADRHLDGLVSLFDLANRLPGQRRGRAGLVGFLDDVQALRIPDQPAAGESRAGDAVQLLSAHRSKGLEWELVVVAGVQEGQWPDLRLRSDLLHVDELGRHGREPARTAADLLVEERRLMYVACTRARSALVVTAVAEPVEGGAQPSRFLADLGVPVVPMAPRPVAPLDAAGLIAALRAAAEAPVVLQAGVPAPQVEIRRQAAIARLAALARRAAPAGAPPGARPAQPGSTDPRLDVVEPVPLRGPLAAAHPSQWWAVRPVSDGAGAGAPALQAAQGEREPAAPDDAAPVVRLSPSGVEALRRCPLQWFLEHRVGAGTPAGAPATMGTIVHAVAEALANGEVSPDMASITPFVDAVWGAMPYAARYQARAERARLDEILQALLRWLSANERRVAAAEASFQVALETGGPVLSVRGSIDRVEVDAEGGLHLVDFKTGKHATSAAAALEHAQLGIYQLAVREGALGTGSIAEPDEGEDAPAGDEQPPRVAGAELVHLADTFASGMPKVRHQPALPEGHTWVHDVLVDAAHLAVGPRYPARRNGRCSGCTFRHMCPARAASAVGDPDHGGAG